MTLTTFGIFKYLLWSSSQPGLIQDCGSIVELRQPALDRKTIGCRSITLNEDIEGILKWITIADDWFPFQGKSFKCKFLLRIYYCQLRAMTHTSITSVFGHTI